jgi:hypothetical protein
MAMQSRARFLAGAATIGALTALGADIPALASGWTTQKTSNGAQLLYNGQVVLQAAISSTTISMQSSGGVFSLPASPVVGQTYEPAPGFQFQYQGNGYGVYTGGTAVATQPQTTGTIPYVSGQTVLLSPTYQYSQKNCDKPPCPQDLAECIGDLLAMLIATIALVFLALAALASPPPIDAAAAGAFMLAVSEYIQLELKTEYDCGFVF